MIWGNISKDITINILHISYFNDIHCFSFVLVVQGVGGAASILILLVIGLSVSVVVMGVCLCQVKYKKCDCKTFNEVRLTKLT